MTHRTDPHPPAGHLEPLDIELSSESGGTLSIELDPQALLELSSPRAAESPRAPADTGATALPIATREPPPARTASTASAPRAHRALARSWLGVAMLSAAVVGGIGAHRLLGVKPATPGQVSQRVPGPATSAAAAAATMLARSSAPPPPVRFANPFDRSEVFEFPAGTSRDEARARVAAVLTQRAAERQVQQRERRALLARKRAKATASS